ncbi:MAG: hypothetical protein ACQERS_10300 [Bacteroidota bacterium]
MKYFIILTGFLYFLCLTNSSGQEPIEIKNMKYYQNGQKKKISEVLVIINDPQAHKLVKTGRRRRNTGFALDVLGVAMMASAFSSYTGSDSYYEENPISIILVGAALAGTGTFLYVHGINRIKEGVVLYNSSLNQAYIQRNKVSVKLGLTQHGLGVSFNF